MFNNTYTCMFNNTYTCMFNNTYTCMFNNTYTCMFNNTYSFWRDHRGRDSMVVGFITTCAISAYLH